jgi:molybdopterin molybdotransferase
LAPVNKQENIRKAGGEFSKGDEILPAGVVVTPPVVGLFAALGMSEFSVGRLPSVALIIIGNELVRPGQALSAGQIYDSNSAGLMSAAKALGLKNITSFFVKDDPDLLQEACLKALASVDILICSGGVSVGDHDFVKPVLKQIGIRTVFWQVAIKPGRPIYFGTFDSANGNKLVFGLPGNTVSTLVTFHQFVKRAILKMMRFNLSCQSRQGRLADPVAKIGNRLDFMRGISTPSPSGELIAHPVVGQQSHMLSGLAQANCLIHVPAEDEFLPEGTEVLIDLLNWNG